MTCCIAIVHYLQCGHKIVFKLGCEEDCMPFCPVASQELVVHAQYVWRCEDCQSVAWAREADARSVQWEAKATRLLRNKTVPQVWRRQMLRTLHARELDEDRRMEKQRLELVQEVQAAAGWTAQYGALIWELLYGGDEDDDEEDDKVLTLAINRMRARKPCHVVVVTDGLSIKQEWAAAQRDTLKVLDSVIRRKPQGATSTRRVLPPVPGVKWNKEINSEDWGMDMDLDQSMELMDLDQTTTLSPKPPDWKDSTVVTVTEAPLTLDDAMEGVLMAVT